MMVKKAELAISSKCAARLTAIALLIPLAAEPCSLPENYRLTEAAVLDRFCAADAVFVGEVEATLNVRDQITETKIWPRRTLKGRVDSPAYALSARLSAKPGRYCDYRFQPLGKYLIFVDRYEDSAYLCVSTCDFTQTLDPESFTFRVITSTTDVEKECSEDASERRQKEHRDEWARRFSEKDARMKELYELTRQLQEANETAGAAQ